MKNSERINPGYLAAGTRIGDYEVVDQVGAGGFGCIYKVRRGPRHYALKIARQQLSELDREDREHYEERFDREVSSLKALRHPNIVRVHSFECWPELEDGFPYIVMDLVDGAPVKAWLRETAPSLAEICRVFERIAGAVAYMHVLGIFHRDLKSENVLVRGDGEPVIVDFGLARPKVSYTVTRMASIGTVTHYSPEYAVWCDSEAFLRGEPFAWAAATDLHALGYMLYEVLAGASPFPRLNGAEPLNEPAILQAIKTVMPEPPSVRNARVPPALDSLTLALLAKDPAKRPASAAEVAKALREAREKAEARQDGAWRGPFEEAEPELRVEVPVVAEPVAAMNEEQIPLIGSQEVPLPHFVEPEPAAAPTFVAPESAEVEAESEDEPARAIPSAIRAAQAQLAASSRARRLNPVVVGGAALILAVLAGLVLLARSESPPARPRTLLTEAPTARPAPPPLAPALAAPVPAPQRQAAVEPERRVGMQGPSLASSTSAPSSADAREIDRDLEREFGRPTVTPDGRIEDRPSPGVEKASAPARQQIADPPWIHRSRSRLASAAPPPAAAPARGVPLGSHLRARLLTNLDSRTIGSGPVEALFTGPVIVKGEVALPARTLAFGTASEAGGRFTIRFTRLRLPDDSEVEFTGIALDRGDGKPGLAAARRLEQSPEQRDGLATRIAKNTGNVLLDTVSGGTAQDIARGAGQTAISHSETQGGGGQTAILLDGGAVFDIWVERSF